MVAPRRVIKMFNPAKVVQYNICDDFALTLTIREPKEDEKKPLYKTQLIKTLTDINYWFIKCMRNYTIVPELTNNGNLHYHARIHISDVHKFKAFLGYWKTKYGFFDVDTINNKLIWFIYMRKDVEAMYQLVELPDEPRFKMPSFNKGVTVGSLSGRCDCGCGSTEGCEYNEDRNHIEEMLAYLKKPKVPKVRTVKVTATSFFEQLVTEDTRRRTRLCPQSE